MGADDALQPKGSMDFLTDMRGERKSLLPPIVASLGVERRREERHLRAQERFEKEQKEAEVKQ